MKDELNRLRKIVDKDPKSTMFVPLAEEYRKQGRLEEATETLKSGLMHQPLYTTGRVALGKVLMERSMLQEAREEFERVLDAMPENIVARKRLAEIYSQQGRTDLAREHEQYILGITPPPAKTAAQAREIPKNPEPTDTAADTVIESPLGAEYTENYPDDEKLDLRSGKLDVGSTSDEDRSVAVEEIRVEESAADEVVGDRADEEASEEVIDIATESMADVYISQNLYEKAMDVLLKVENQSPENKSVRQKIEDLRMLMNITNGGDVSRG